MAEIPRELGINMLPSAREDGFKKLQGYVNEAPVSTETPTDEDAADRCVIDAGLSDDDMEKIRDGYQALDPEDPGLVAKILKRMQADSDTGEV